MSLVRGKDTILYVYNVDGYYPAMCATGMTFNAPQEMIPATSVNGGNFKQFVSGMTSWTVSLEGILQNVNSGGYGTFDFLLAATRQTGVDIKLVYTDPDGIDRVLSGHAFIPNVSIRDNVADFALTSVELQGSGAYTIGSFTTPNPGSVFSYIYTGTGGETSFTYAPLINRTILEALWFRAVPTEVITVGTPNAAQVKYTSTTGTFDIEPAVPFTAGEKILILYQ